MAFNGSGEILNALGRYREARTFFGRGSIWERQLGSDHRNLAYPLTGIGVGYLAEGKATEALVPLERAVSIREAHEPELSRLAETKFALARALWKSNRSQSRARSLAKEARQAYTKSSAEDENKVRQIDGWLKSDGEPLNSVASSLPN